ncbi:hypothetical protein EJB05_12484, partial [Eragrostis curvula]
MAAAEAHVLVFPVPAQGHLNCMLHFATGLLAAGLHVTFLHTDHNLRRLGGAAAAAASSPRLRFLSVPDGLPDDHPRLVDSVAELLESMWTRASASYRALLSSLLLRHDNDGDEGVRFPPVTCVVADGILPFAVDIAEELGVPAIAFRTVSASAVLAYLSIPRLIDLGELPFPEGANLDEPVRGVPGMEGFLRRRDLPVQCRLLTSNTNVDEPLLQTVVPATAHHAKARALLLNTSASLEPSALSHLKHHMRDVFAVGPLHAMSPAPAAATSLWRQDDGTAAWLDGHADRSVVYVSLGSLAVFSSHDQLAEFLSGLVAAGYAFLWVIRPDMVVQDAALLREAVAAVGESKARVVPWVAQRDVLRHRAVGCFLTHSGWNSTVEGLVEGVPMVCWPFFVDQQVNSRFVGAVWKTGMDMKDVCDRAVVEKMVKEAMESAEIRGSAQALAEQLKQDVADGGSSAMEFQRLITFIRELSKSSERPGNRQQPALVRSELGVVAAHLAADLHLRDAEHDMAVRVRHRAELEHPEHGDLPGDRGAGVERHGSGLQVLDKLRQLRPEAVGQHRHHHRHVAVAAAREAAGLHRSFADEDAAVPELRVPGVEGEGRRVRVVHGHGQEHRDVELQRRRQGRGEADEARGDEASGRVADAEHRQEQDEQGDAEEEEDAESDEEADAAAATATAALVGGELAGRRRRGVGGENAAGG